MRRSSRRETCGSPRNAAAGARGGVWAAGVSGQGVPSSVWNKSECSLDSSKGKASEGGGAGKEPSASGGRWPVRVEREASRMRLEQAMPREFRHCLTDSSF